MDLWQAALLGLVEGLTEYLPVSSTAHLLLAQRALGLPQSDAANAFAICIQAGAILAVFALYHRRLARVAAGVVGRDVEGRRLFLSLAIAFVPAAVIGKLCDEPIERVLFGLWPVVAAWLAGGVFLLLLARRDALEDGAGIEALTPKIAAIIGLCQCAALWPGVSRSLATIAGGLLCGLGLAAAIEFSFLLGLLTLGAATVYKGAQQGSNLLDTYTLTSMLAGLCVAFVSAWLSVRWMVRSLGARALAWFGVYRIGLASVVAVLLALGVLHSV
ncbi:MAG TPA: undecaprenyl-diphosphate phosphatase [Planctomycetota bacterium]|nr:undecaprenyl-diphosphate phosphatase [Planctomycetota bacterium]